MFKMNSCICPGMSCAIEANVFGPDAATPDELSKVGRQQF